eukprot:748897-Pleurochrysis_carterae.AAC.1
MHAHIPARVSHTCATTPPRLPKHTLTLEHSAHACPNTRTRLPKHTTTLAQARPHASPTPRLQAHTQLHSSARAKFTRSALPATRHRALRLCIGTIDV